MFVTDMGDPLQLHCILEPASFLRYMRERERERERDNIPLETLSVCLLIELETFEGSPCDML